MLKTNTEQVTIVWPWIDPEFWQPRFSKYMSDQIYIQEILKQAGW